LEKLCADLDESLDEFMERFKGKALLHYQFLELGAKK
jgi:hypothetical protein